MLTTLLARGSQCKADRIVDAVLARKKLQSQLGVDDVDLNAVHMLDPGQHWALIHMSQRDMLDMATLLQIDFHLLQAQSGSAGIGSCCCP